MSSGRLGWLIGLGVVYAAAGAWLVGVEAAAYRRALHARRPDLTPAAAVPTPPEVAATTTTTAAPAAPVEPPPPAPAAPPVEARSAAPRTPEPEPAPAVALAPAKAEPPGPSAPGTGSALAALVVSDLVKLPAAEEARLGKLLHMLVVANHGEDDEGPYQAAIVSRVRPVLDLWERKDIEITITVLDSDDVNAFSHLGGYIYVTRGLFSLAASDEDYQFVVAHEMAHLEGKHAQALVDEATRAGRLAGVGTLQALYHQIAAGFTPAQDFEADEKAIDRLLKLDHTKRECLSFPRKLVGLSEQAGFRNGGKPPKTGPSDPVQDVDNHLRSQPAARERLERLQKRFTPPVARPGAGPGR